MSNPFDEDFDDNAEYIDDEFDLEDEDAPPMPAVLSSDIDLQSLGMHHVGYVKLSTVNGVTGFTVHAADGTPMIMAPDRDLAHAVMMQHDLMLVSLH
jgi:hypothetical protein